MIELPVYAAIIRPDFVQSTRYSGCLEPDIKLLIAPASNQRLSDGTRLWDLPQVRPQPWESDECALAKVIGKKFPSLELQESDFELLQKIPLGNGQTFVYLANMGSSASLTAPLIEERGWVSKNERAYSLLLEPARFALENLKPMHQYILELS